MKRVENQSAQGDVFVRRITALPNDAREITPTDGRHIVAHSETGHHHYVHAEGVRFYESRDPLVCYLAIGGPECELTHARPFHTHEALGLSAGVWELRRQREMTPDGWARAQD